MGRRMNDPSFGLMATAGRLLRRRDQGVASD
jgi:hypothetical protein